jgi:TRAP-type C4-dicarboxylate transport system permease small subunit
LAKAWALTLAARADGLVGSAVDAAAWLTLPLAALLFLQWPLRDLVGSGSRPANDLAQCLFAVHAAVALTAATRSGQHLAPQALFPVARGARFQRHLARLGIVAGLLPWSLWMLWSSAATIAQSVIQLESFPDSYNPGYFVVKLAAGLLAGLVLVQALIDLARPLAHQRGDASVDAAAE